MSETNKLTQEMFEKLHEPYLTRLITAKQFAEAKGVFAGILKQYTMEPELRVEILFGIAVCQFHVAMQFQQHELAEGQKLAKELGITHVEREMVKQLIVQYVTKYMGEQNGKAE